MTRPRRDEIEQLWRLLRMRNVLLAAQLAERQKADTLAQALRDINADSPSLQPGTRT